MKKSDLISKIEEYDANLVWEIDNPDYYGLIGWNGGKDDSYWLTHNLEGVTNKTLTNLLNDLKKIKEML
jgi:hypothetical protein